MLSLISIHIPKTGGTNFIETLKLVYGNRIHQDYGTERDLVTARTPAPEIVADPESFRQGTDIIHGHFHYLKYKALFPDVPVLTTLRHPVDRVISQYRHIALHGDMNVPRHQWIMEGRMDVVHFSRFYFIANAQSVFLEGIGVDDLAHAIIQEHFALTVRRFCEKVGFDPQHPKVLQLTDRLINSREGAEWNTDAVPVDDGARAEIEKNCADDLALFDRALERFVK